MAQEIPATHPDEERLARGVLEIARQLAAELHPNTPALGRLDVDASIERDLGLDSLARAELAQRIRRTLSIATPETALAEAETVRELAHALAHAPAIVGPPLASEETAGAAPEAAASAPPSPATLLDALEWHAAEHPQAGYVLFVDREDAPEHLTYGALRRQAIGVATGLMHRGVRPGETVALMLPTGPAFFAAFFGALYAQAIPVPLYPPARPSQIESHLRRVAAILSNCEARVLLTFHGVQRIAGLLRGLDTRLELTTTPDEIAVEPEVFRPPVMVPGDTAFLQYTSGSTGQPKGVVLTHANLMANISSMQRVTGVTSEDRFVSWLPLYHDMGLIGACFGALVAGFPLVLMSPFTFLSRPVRWLRAIHRHQATITAAPNFAFELCLHKIDDEELAGLDLGSLRLTFSGAEAVSASTLDRFAERFGRYGLRRESLMPVYGLAECSLGLTFPPVGRGPLIDRISRDELLLRGIARPADPADPSPLRVVSCGAALPGHSIRIVDERGTALPERTQGRIEFRGPSATSGYFRNPGETAKLFDGDWLDTGDLGYLAGGELYVTGRAKDVIIRGGHNIHPQELEEAIAQLPGIRKGGVAVFPATDRRSGTERVIVLAETREEDPDVRAKMISTINQLAVDLIGVPVDEVVLAPPRTVLKTSSGKIRRTACRDAYEHGRLGTAARSPWLQLTRLSLQAWRGRASRALRRSAAMLWGVWALLVSACLALVLFVAVAVTPGHVRRRRLVGAFVRTALRICGIRLEIDGPQFLLARRPCVFVANHASYLDGPLLAAVLPPDVAFVAKRELVTSILLGRLLTRLGCVFVERYDVQEATTGARQMQARLSAGESLVAFPEGTFQRDPGLLPFHMGAFAAAAQAGAAVVPIAIRGTRDMLPDGARLPRPAALHVIAGEPLLPNDGSWRAAVELRRRAREHVLAHAHEPDLEWGTPRIVPGRRKSPVVKS